MTPEGDRDLYVYNGGLLTGARLRRMLGLAGWRVTTGVPGDGDWVGVWGRSPTEPRGRKVAELTDNPVLTVEDAFLRSVQPGRVGNEPPAGLLLDRTGVHFDGRSTSDLETLMETAALDDTHLLNRARTVIERMRYWHLGKYAAVDPGVAAPEPGYVVVLDQTRGDASLLGAGRADFLEMLMDAKANHPAAPILIRTHPETEGGAREGHFRVEDCDDRVSFAPDAISPWHLFTGAVAVYTHSSLGGFEAVLAGHNPHVFGYPFYAGWGLTQDRQVFPRRTRKLTRAQIVAAAYIEAPVWYDARRDRLCEVEDVISDLAAKARAWREDRDGWRMPGMRLWKRPHMARGFGRVRFSERGEGRLAVWGAEGPEEAVKIEDGFLRSDGIGARLVPPVSLVTDAPSLYFDPSRESGLDRLIAASGDLPPAEIERARHVIELLTRAGLTKYDNQRAEGVSDAPKGVLVVGQVEDDASVRLGANGISTNAALLAKAVDESAGRPVLYKPHPDVEAGLREGAVDEVPEGVEVLAGGSTIDALARAEEVWTMTSTMGFEALLRGVPVTCTGMPFYAGWGLTRDLSPAPPHRAAKPTLEGLAHAALIGYPRYFDPATGEALSVEAAIRLLAHAPPVPLANRWLAKAQGVWVSLRRR